MLSEESKVCFLKRVFGKADYSHNTHELAIFCPFCFHYKKKLFINVDTDLYHCFVCGKAGKNLYDLIKKCGTKTALDEYCKSFKSKNISFDNFSQQDFCITLPYEYVPLSDHKGSVLYDRAWQYIEKRGLSDNDVLKYKIGTATTGKYSDRIILPSFDKNGELNFFTSRAIGSSPLKYLDPDVPRGYKKSVILNELNIDWNKPITLVEGYFDAYKAENAIPLFGSILRPEHAVFQSVVRNSKSVYLAGDSDAISKFYSIGKLFLEYDVDAYFVDVRPFKDVGEMTRKQFLEKRNNALLLTQQAVFKNKLQRLFE